MDDPSHAGFTPDRINAPVVEFAVTDWRRSLRFYQDTLGFTLEYTRPAEGFAYVSFGVAQIMFYQMNRERNIVGTGRNLRARWGVVPMFRSNCPIWTWCTTAPEHRM